MKKGSFIITTETLLWSARLVFLIVVAFSVFFVVSSHARREIKIEEFEMDILITRLVYSPSCLVYNDSRGYPGVIDLEKFIEDRLGNCSYRDDLSAKLVLIDLDGNEVAKIFKNKDEFIMLEPLCGFEKYKCVNRQRYVLIYDKGNLKEGILNVTMVME